MESSKLISFEMWICGHHAWHCRYRMLKVAGSGLWCFLNQTDMREIWVSIFLLVAVQSPLRGKGKTRICWSKAHSKLCQETHACQSPPVQRRSITPEHMRSPVLEHSAHIHETFEMCGCRDHWGISRGNVYHHVARYHKNNASISFARGSHHRVLRVFARQPFANQEN